MGKNLTHLISHQANIRPNAIAIALLNKTITYQELDHLIWTAASFFNDKDINTQDTVALLCEDELLLMICMLALARLGITSCTISLYTPELQLLELLQKIKATVSISTINSNKRGDIRLHIPISLETINFYRTPLDRTLQDDTLQKPWMYVVGSGSTGKSKIIPISHQQQLARITISHTWLPITPQDKVSSMVHLNYNASKDLYLQALAKGATIVLFDKANVNTVDSLRCFTMSVLHVTVFHLQQILQLPLQETQPFFSRLKVLLVGGSTVSQLVRDSVEKNLTKNLYVRYGINEIGSVSVATSPDVFLLENTVGKPIAMNHVEVVNAKNTVLTHNCIGYIRIKSPGMIEGYFEDEEATHKAFKEGWFYPGDLGKFTEEGQLIYCGRADHMMIMNGINIYPAEIESVVTKHPDVLDAAVMPIKHSVHQDIPLCAVVLKKKNSVTREELLRFCYERLGSRGPQEMIILEAIPRNEQGKLIREAFVKAIVAHLTQNATT